MKKLLFAVILAAITITSVNAQNFGAKAGLNLASITGDNTDQNKSLLGFHAGVVAEFEISEQLSFQPELLFSVQGAKAETSGEVLGVKYSSEVTSKRNYITLPLMVKYNVNDTFNIHAGPQVGFLMSHAGEATTTVGSESETTTSDKTDGMSKLDLGINIGLGYKMESGLFFDARYNLGLSNINDVDGSDVSNKNAVIQFSVGYFFM